MNWVQAAIVAAVLIPLGYGAHVLDVNRIEKKHASELSAQKDALKQTCEAEKKITEETADAIQKKNADLANRLVAAKRVHAYPADCVPVIPNAAAGNDGEKKDAGLPRQDGKPFGVKQDALLDFANDAEAVGILLDQCQAYTTKVRAYLNGNKRQ